MVFLCELDELDPFAIEPIAIPDFKMVQWMKLVCDDAEENSCKILPQISTKCKRRFSLLEEGTYQGLLGLF